GLVVYFHTFVHLGIEDPLRYLAGTPVWRMGGIHLASLLSEEGWRKLVAEAPLHQGGKVGSGICLSRPGDRRAALPRSGPGPPARGPSRRLWLRATHVPVH